MNDFFSHLREKIWQPPDRNFDQRFWATFDAETVGSAMAAPSLIDRLRGLALSRWGAGLAAAAIVVLMVLSPSIRTLIKPEISEVPPAEVASAEWSEFDTELLEDLDMFAELEDVSLDDNEWDYLLTGQGGEG